MLLDASDTWVNDCLAFDLEKRKDLNGFIPKCSPSSRQCRDCFAVDHFQYGLPLRRGAT